MFTIILMRCTYLIAAATLFVIPVNSLGCAATRSAPSTQPAHRAAWMRRGHWGVMSHYLADWIARRENLPEHRMTVEQWNEAVDHFDVEALADQIQSTG